MSTDPWAVVSLNPGLGLSRLHVLVSNIYTLAQVERELAVARQNQAFKPDSEDEQEENRCTEHLALDGVPSTPVKAEEPATLSTMASSTFSTFMD